MKNMYRVFVKLEGSKRYQAVEQVEGGIAVAPTNKIYHSFFSKADADRLASDMQEQGLDTKVDK